MNPALAEAAKNIKNAVVFKDIMENLLIRPYHPDDEKEVIDLWQDCHLASPQNNPRSDIQRKLKVNPEWFLIGILEGNLVASCMAGYDGHRGWINYLAVLPAYRHRGIATQVLKEAERRLRAAGCPKINLQIRETNTHTIQFYERIGFQRDPVLSMGKRLIADPLSSSNQIKTDQTDESTFDPER
jgi:ribosomal protein S18 acetylase RimI-like enzyme